MKLLITLAFFLVIPIDLYCQTQSDDYLHTRSVMERLITNSVNNPTGAMPIMNSAPIEIKGDVYLSKSYGASVFQLYSSDKLIQGYSAKLDLNKNEFDLITSQGIRTLKGELVKSFAITDSITGLNLFFLNSNEWKGAPRNCFLQILSQGNMILAKRTELIFIKSNFNPALNVGSKQHKYLKKEHLYYAVNGEMMSIPSKRKSLPSIFQGRQNDVEKFIKINELDVSKQRHLIIVFNYVNDVK
jgi:hypothetical protein